MGKVLRKKSRKVERCRNPDHLIIYRNRLDISINTQAIILFYLLTYLLIYLLRCGGLQILFTTVAIFATVNAADCKSTETIRGDV